MEYMNHILDFGWILQYYCRKQQTKTYVRLEIENFKILSCNVQVPFPSCGDIRQFLLNGEDILTPIQMCIKKTLGKSRNVIK